MKTRTTTKAPAARAAFLLALAAVIGPLLSVSAAALDSPEQYLEKYLKAVRNYRPAPAPSEQIYIKNDVLYCTGGLEVAKLNNIAADMISFGEYFAAKTLLDRGLARTPLFFPYLYNIGICCLHLRELDLGLIHLNKAVALVPEYSRTYLQRGYLYQLKADDDEAIRQFRTALKVNHYELEALILIGDIYYARSQIVRAERYYRASLNQDPTFSNGLIGLSKIYFHKKEYAGTIVTLKGVNLEQEYDKAYHYYYAESAYKLMDYKTALEQYTTLLTFKNDKFFITHARSLIQHKVNLTAKFVEK